MRHLPAALAFLIAFTGLTVRPGAQDAGVHVWRADSLDSAAIQRYKGNITSVLGRVMKTSEIGGRPCLILDGGALHVLASSGENVEWSGKLIEATSLIEATPQGKPGSTDLPPFRMFQLAKRSVRMIPETRESAKSVLIRRTPPGKIPPGRLEPPGTRPDAKALAAVKIPFTQEQSWTRRNGKKVTVRFNGWSYRERTGADLRTREWVVEMFIANPHNPIAYYLPEDLDLSPPDAERLRVALWKELLPATDGAETGAQAAMKKQEPLGPVTLLPGLPSPAEELADTVGWEEKLKNWGHGPLPQGVPKTRRLPGPDDFGNVPDLRQPTVVKLLKPSAKGRTSGTLVLLDWAMTGEPASTKVTAKVRWSDGVEDTVTALYLAPEMVFKRGNMAGLFSPLECGLIFMRDWVRAKEKNEILPGRDLKIRAMRQFLRVWWNSPGVLPFALPQTGPSPEQKVKAAADLTAQQKNEARQLTRWGTRPPFPGLPPDGFEELAAPLPDRSLMTPWPAETPGFVNESAAQCHAVIFNWWAAAGLVPLPEKQGLKRSPEALLRYLSRNNATREMLSGYASKLLDGEYIFQLTTDMDCSPANLARYTAGAHAVILSFRSWENKMTQKMQHVAVTSILQDGTLTFCAWGRKVQGILKRADLRGMDKIRSTPQSTPVECYELEVTGPQDVREMLEKQQRCLILDNWRRSPVQAVTPYRKAASAASPVRPRKS